MKLLEEEEKEKREEEERKERRRMKEREKKLRRKERLKGKDRDKEKKSSLLDDSSITPDVTKEESSASVNEEPNNAASCRDSVSEIGDNSPTLSRPGSPDIQEEHFSNGYTASRSENYYYDSLDGEVSNAKDGDDSFQTEQSKFSRRRLNFRKEVQSDSPSKWSERRRFAAAAENGSAVSKSESRVNTDHLETSAKSINGLNRPMWMNTSKSCARSGNMKFNERIHCSNNRMNDRYDSHSCGCSQPNEYRAKVEPHVSARVSREPKSVGKLETGSDMSKQFYRGNKYNQTDFVRDGSGRPKTKIINGNSTYNRDTLYSKKVWEPMESQKYTRSNSDSDVTLRSTTFKGGVENVSIKSAGVMFSSEATGNLGDVGCENDDAKQSRDTPVLINEACLNDHNVGAKNSFCSKAASYEAPVLCHNGISDPVMSSTSNSDNCSSCLSEGDSNTVSSNHGNLESSTTSDSEDASQQSEGKDISVCTQNGFSDCNEVVIEKSQCSNGAESLTSRPGGLTTTADSIGSKCLGNLPSKNVQNPEIGISNANIGSQHQGLYPPLPSQNLQFPMFQPSSTMGYYHQNPVSWPAAPANGLMPFPNPTNYLYAGPIGYRLNGSSPLCMQYGSMQHVSTPLYNPGPVPVYQPVIKANGITEEQNYISKQSAVEDAASHDDANKERVVPSRPAQVKGGNGLNDHSGEHHGNGNSFSLFHFGGPVALSTGCKLNPVPSKDEIVGNFSSQFSADHIENDNACDKKGAGIEEYNLFATSNGLSFSFF